MPITIKQLIKYLKKFDQDLPVKINYDYYWYCDICIDEIHEEDIFVDNQNKETKKVIVLNVS